MRASDVGRGPRGGVAGKARSPLWQSGGMPTATPVAPGLTDVEVAARIASGQVNELPPRSGRTVADIVRANLLTRINAILAVLLVIVLATGSWINAAFGLLIIANSAVGIVTEIRANVPLRSLFGYSTDLRSATQGRAVFTMQFLRYDTA